MTRHKRDQLMAIRKAGLIVIAAKPGARHTRYQVRAPDGRTAVLFGAQSPSCQRAARAFAADARRFARSQP